MKQENNKLKSVGALWANKAKNGMMYLTGNLDGLKELFKGKTAEEIYKQCENIKVIAFTDESIWDVDGNKKPYIKIYEKEANHV